MRDSSTPSEDFPVSTVQTTPVGDALGGYNMDGVKYDERTRFSKGPKSPSKAGTRFHTSPDRSSEQSTDMATRKGDGPCRWKPTLVCCHDPRLTLSARALKSCRAIFH